MLASLFALAFITPASAAYLGLRNQGNTCYMNSLLQSLHHLTPFRRAVYSIPTGGKAAPAPGGKGEAPPKAEESVPELATAMALQQVFYELEKAEDLGAGVVGTEGLTRSFGWSTREVMVQQDVQEFARMLFEVLQASMRARGVGDGVADLFEGATSSVTRCTRVDFSSVKDERFYDLQLPVCNCRNLHASLRQFVAEEKLHGANQYNTRDPELGRQDARRSVRFKRLPRILQFHLKRFEYDAQTGGLSKLQSEFRVPTTLRLGRYMAAGCEERPAPIYELHSVLSHVGDAGAGHYVAYVRPGSERGAKKWYEFDDSNVREVPQEAAVRKQYGGRFSSPRDYMQRYGGAAPNAYMLVYVQREEEPEEGGGAPSEALPEEIHKAFEAGIRRRTGRRMGG